MLVSGKTDSSPAVRLMEAHKKQKGRHLGVPAMLTWGKKKMDKKKGEKAGPEEGH